jgi:PHD/YefM family antitoxin component YafN of YafNO toxin-antitoxin module
MSMNALLKQATLSKIGRKQVVTLPVAAWEKLKEKIEDLEEDYLMATSENYKKSIAKARAGKGIDSKEVYRSLGLI